MTIRYDSEDERKLHSSAIHSLADHFAVDESAVRDIYERKLEELMGHARVKTYLSVLAARHVKSHLNETYILSSETALTDHAH